MNRAYLLIFKSGLLNVLFILISYVEAVPIASSLKNNTTMQQVSSTKSQATQLPKDEGANSASLLEQNKETTTSNSISSIIAHESNKYIKRAKTTHDTPLSLLDTLIIKHCITYHPYAPLLENFDIRVHYSDLILSGYNSLYGQLFNNSYNFTAGIDLFFKRNIQVSGDCGYCYCSPPNKIVGNEKKYKSQGIFGGLGMAYLVKHFAHNLYGGMYYNMSIFTNTVLGTNISNKLSAYWAKLIVGSEKKIRHSNWYFGSRLGINFLIDADDFMPAENYYIPGYGSSFKYITFEFKLYIKYTLSLVKKILTS